MIRSMIPGFIKRKSMSSSTKDEPYSDLFKVRVFFVFSSTYAKFIQSRFRIQQVTSFVINN